MVWYLLIAVLAAFGLFSAIWAAAGWLLPVCQDGWLLYPGKREGLTFVYVYLWLRGMGLVRCPLCVIDLGLSEAERSWLGSKEIELCPPEDLPKRLRIGVEGI